MKINILLVTSRSISFQVETHENFYLDKKIILKYNDKKVELIKVVDTIYDLEPATEYFLTLEQDGLKIDEIKVTTETESFTLNVKKFGAKGDGVSNDTLALQTAIMSCPKDGRVYIPKGKYLITSIFLKDNLT